MIRSFILSLLLSCSFISAATTTSTLDPLHIDWLDQTVSLHNDFYTYANGTWKKNNPIPPEYASWGSFSVLAEKNLVNIHHLLEQIAAEKNLKPGSIEQKVGDFYFSGMDVNRIEQLGVTPLKPEFDKIEAVHDQLGLQAEIAHLHRLGVDALFNFGSMQDFKNSQRMIAVVMQGGLSLPDKDYYLKSEPKFVKIREQFTQHMIKMFELLGDNPTLAQQEANTVMALETALAKASLSQIEQRDPHAIYHMQNLQQLSTLAPHVSWSNYFKAMGLEQLSAVNMAMPTFMKAVNQLLVDKPLSEWKAYLRWHLISDAAPYLSTPFVAENFHMVSQLTGAKSLPPRWKQVVATENGLLGFAVGELYVKKYFSKAAKQNVLEMIKQIRQVLRQDLKQLSWMTETTRQAAIRKLDTMKERVGYPDKWRDYTSLTIDRGPYILNVLRGSAYLVNRDLQKIDKPVDRTEWDMTPQTVNAYYDPSMNNINIPMGILQPPYYDLNAPASVNYGAIGAVIGHEITHGFDDQGSKFDEYGNLHNWWQPIDLKKFQAATHCIIDQFSHYKIDGDVAVQGPLVVGEATADLGGLILSYRAFHASDEYKRSQVMQELTPDQQFFISYAHVWANNIRPEQALNLILIDPHPPTKYRVNGTLANMPQFQSDFNIPDASLMVNKQRCVIW